jgi:hypothetical protein
MHDGENGSDDESLQYMSETDLMVELMDLLSQDGISDNKLLKILDYQDSRLSRFSIMSSGCFRKRIDWCGPIMWAVRRGRTLHDYTVEPSVHGGQAT